jgi:hypothetical protein
MNSLEMHMVDILKELKDKHSAIAVRAEFEAEGTKLEELLRLKEISLSAGLGLALKIGGCESVRDMLESRIVGVNYLIAPMVESAYSLHKYLQAVKKVFSPEELKGVEILCNIETITACNNFKSMLKMPEIHILKGIVIERVDLCFSLGHDEKYVNNKEIYQIVTNIIKLAKKNHLVCTLGGGLSAESLRYFDAMPELFPCRYETRKVCFSHSKSKNSYEKSILKALGFELLWLKNKVSFCKAIYAADKERVAIIEQSYLKEIDRLI